MGLDALWWSRSMSAGAVALGVGGDLAQRVATKLMHKLAAIHAN
jgi:hypothetical protein